MTGVQTCALPIFQYRFFPLSPQGDTNARGQRNRLTSALLDLTRDEEEIGGTRRIELFRDAVSSWLNIGGIALPLKDGAQVRAQAVELDDGGRYISRWNNYQHETRPPSF